VPTKDDPYNLSFDFTSPPPPPKKPADEGPKTFTVAQLDRMLKVVVDDAFAQSVWVGGEVTGARAAPTGHLYFCLRDEEEDASIDVVLYRTNLTPRARTLLVDGARVRLRGRPTVWAPRGRLQFVADRAEAAGRGALLEALERLKAKLAAEGLFAEERKRPLPAEPRIVGVVTSAHGAVIHDVCRVAFRRGGAHILLAPAQVQGAGAADSIRRALQMLARVPRVDAIIVGRGGGSSDDLAAFNEEAVVRAVAACPVPVVSAVGHEVDVTLTDFAADVRAATPSQAAELLVPDARARAEHLAGLRRRLVASMRGEVNAQRVALGRLARRVGDPRLAIASHQQTLDDRTVRLSNALTNAITRRRDALARAGQRLAYVHPRAVVDRERAALARATDRLAVVWTSALEKRAALFAAATARLDALSPLKVLGRGYAIAERADGRAVRGAEDVAPGDVLAIRVHRARIEAEVRKVEGPEDEG
jgi:exodeoxyribonuclease VII large subunit